MRSLYHNSAKKSGLQKQAGLKKQLGTIIILVMVVMMILFMNLAILSIVLVRGMGEEGILLTQNVSARKATEIATERLKKQIYDYFGANGLNANIYTSPASGAFRQGGSDDIDGDTLQVQNPEGGVMENTPIRIWSWVSAKRGNYYQIKSRAVLGEIDLTTSRWEMLYPCSATGQLVRINPGDYSTKSFKNLRLDSKHDRVYWSDVGGDDLVYTWREDTGLETASAPGGLTTETAWVVDEAQEKIYFADWDSGTSVYSYKRGGGFNTIGTCTDACKELKYDQANERLYWVNWVDDPNADIGHRYNPTDGDETTFSLIYNAQFIAFDPHTENYFFKDTNGIVYLWGKSFGTKQLSSSPASQFLYSAGAKKLAFFGTVGANAINVWDSEKGLSQTTPITFTSFGGAVISQKTGRLFFAANSTIYSLFNDKLTTLHTGVSGFVGPMYWDEVNGRLFFYNSSNLYMWTQSTGLVTTFTGVSNDRLAWNAASGMIFYAKGDTIYRWTQADGEQLLAHITGLSAGSLVFDDINARLYIVSNDSLITWKLGDSNYTYLSPLSSDARYQFNQYTGRLYFIGENNNVFYYNPPELCAKNFASTKGSAGSTVSVSSDGCDGGLLDYCEVAK